jgi:hypothetical protein
MTNRYGALPLHAACRSGTDATFEVVKFLLEQHPDGIDVRDSSGNLPLHCAATNGDVDTVDLLLGLFPEAVRETNNEGLLPIHHACWENASHQSIQTLIDHYIGDPLHRNGLAVASRFEQIPLHFAALNGSITRETLQLLVGIYPEGIRIADSRNRLPLHLACSDEWSSDRIERVRFFVETDLFTVLETCFNDHGTTPLLASFILPDLEETTTGIPIFGIGAGPMDPGVRARLLETRRFLLEKQDEALEIYCEALECLPDHIVIEDILGFAYGRIWRPTEDEVNTIEE